MLSTPKPHPVRIEKKNDKIYHYKDIYYILISQTFQITVKDQHTEIVHPLPYKNEKAEVLPLLGVGNKLTMLYVKPNFRG